LKQKILHLGISHKEAFLKDDVEFSPIIHLSEIPIDKSLYASFSQANYLIVTSKAVVSFFLKPFRNFINPKIKILAIGKSTKLAIEKENFSTFKVAKEATQEGMIELVSQLDLKDQLLLYPHSDLARKNLRDFLIKNKILHHSFSCYKTEKNPFFAKKDLQSFHGVYFTSPSCVRFFFETYECGYEHLICYCIGDVTTSYLKDMQSELLSVKRIVNMKNNE
jgi:uroporphyrinogen-III synthase